MSLEDWSDLVFRRRFLANMSKGGAVKVVETFILCVC